MTVFFLVGKFAADELLKIEINNLDVVEFSSQEEGQPPEKQIGQLNET